MEANDMKSVAELTASIMGKFEHLAGECGKHGAIENVLTRRGDPWRCPRCIEDDIAAEKRDTWLAERNATLMAIAKIPSKYAGQKFVAATDDQKFVRKRVIEFREFIVKQPRTWAVLVLAGKMGTGKTLMACEFAESLIKKLSMSVRYVTAQGIIGEIQATYGQEGKNEETEIARFAQYDLLIVDEADAKRSTDNANALINEVINRRYAENKPIVVITNQSLEGLAPFVGDRVVDRLHENAFVCSFNWASARRAQQQ